MSGSFFWKHEMRSDVLYFHHVCVQSWTAWMRLVTTEYQRMAHSWPQCSCSSPGSGGILSPGSPWLSPGLEILSSLERETEISAAVLCWSSGLAPGPGWKAAPLCPGSAGCVSASLSRCEEAHVPMSESVMSWAMSSQSNLISGHRQTPVNKIKSALDKEISHSKAAENKLLELGV